VGGGRHMGADRAEEYAARNGGARRVGRPGHLPARRGRGRDRRT